MLFFRGQIDTETDCINCTICIICMVEMSERERRTDRRSASVACHEPVDGRIRCDCERRGLDGRIDSNFHREAASIRLFLSLSVFTCFAVSGVPAKEELIAKKESDDAAASLAVPHLELLCSAASYLGTE